MKNGLTPEQFAQYEAIVNEYDRYRKLSPEEKEDLIIRIATSTYIDLMCDWAFKHDTDKLIYHYLLREVAGKESYSKPDILNLYLCELPRLASKPGKSLTPVEVWFDILQNMSNFATKPEIYGKKYDPIFESSLQSPIPDKDKIQYFRSMFDTDVRSYLTEEDRQEIAQEFLAKGIELGESNHRTKVAKAMLADKMSPELVSKYTGMTEAEVLSLQ